MREETEYHVNIKNYNGVDLAKFICAILVVAMHVAPFGSDDSGISSLLNYGVRQWFARIAVPFFFVASGFFLYRKSGYDGFSVEATKKYVFKLLRLYIIWTILYFPLKAEVVFHHKRGVVHGVLAYIRNFIFTGSFTQLWYLPATIFAVIAVSFLLSKKVGINAILMIAALFYALGLLAQSWFGLITPLRTLAPSLWAFLKSAQKVIVTTRDGLFEGFLFVAMGAAAAYKGLRITRKRALTGLVISYILMLFEVVFVTRLGILRSNDTYIFLVPLTYFAFGLAVNLQLPDKEIYRTLRLLSSLIFYIHLWVCWLIQEIFSAFGRDIGRTCLLFILTAAISIIASLIIVKLSDVKHFNWLKKLYS